MEGGTTRSSTSVEPRPRSQLSGNPKLRREDNRHRVVAFRAAEERPARSVTGTNLRYLPPEGSERTSANPCTRCIIISVGSAARYRILLTSTRASEFGGRRSSVPDIDRDLCRTALCARLLVLGAAASDFT